MSQSNSFGSRPTTHTKLHSQPSKGHILQWISSILPSADPSSTIESLGSGQTYCRIMSHYFPGVISANRIISSPLNEYQYSLNLKQFQKSLAQVKINIPFDIQKVCRLKFSENWSLVLALYKALEGTQSPKDSNEVKTPKRPLPEQREVSEGRKTLQQNGNLLNDLSKRNDIFGMGSILSQVERVKQILIGSYNDTYKVMMIKKLFGIEEVKVEEVNEYYMKEANFWEQFKRK